MVTTVVLDEARTYALVDEAHARVAARWRERVIGRLAEALDRDLRRDGPPAPPTTEQQAVAILQQVAEELAAAATALERAAFTLKEKAHLSVPASAAYQAAMRAKQAHLKLTGGHRG